MTHQIVIKRLFICLLLLLLAGCGKLGKTDYENAIYDGLANLNLNKPENALADFSRAIKFDPQKAGGYVGRGNTLTTLGRHEEAIADFDRALAIDPSIANAYVNRGIAHSHLKNYQKAIDDYEKGLSLDPKIDNPPTFVKRLFSNEPNQEKGIRKHLEHLKKIVQEGSPPKTG